MNFAGIQKLTLLDYPERTACTLFTSGCDLRCPFCHNARLVLAPTNDAQITEEEVLTFLKKRSGLLDGVCVTGGEPLLHYTALREFLHRVRESGWGYSIKLDTNGTFPERLSRLIDEGLINYVAMDVKNALPYYAETVGVAGFDVAPIRESIELLLSGAVEYEFRTTVVREYHTVERIREAARTIRGARRYYLQGFVDTGELIGRADGQKLTAVPPEEVALMCTAANEFCTTKLRGQPEAADSHRRT